MRIRTTAAAATITAALLLTGCSSSDDGNDKPTHATTAPTTAPAKLSKAEVTQRCITALVDQAVDDLSSEVGATRPEECAQLDDSEYANAILDATQQANQAGRDQLQDDVDAGTGGAG